MLSFVRGNLVEKSALSPRGAYFLVDVHGVGFEVLSSQRSVDSAGQPGETILLYTSMVVREDAMFLVGFNSREERDLFNILQSASGVGTKVALALLSSLSVSDIAQAVVSGNHQILTRAKGVGPKLAQKITLELKEKMMSWRVNEPAVTQLRHASPREEAVFMEAESVLLSLGYHAEEVSRSFAAVQEELGDRLARAEASSEEVLRESLRWLARSV